MGNVASSRSWLSLFTLSYKVIDEIQLDFEESCEGKVVCVRTQCNPCYSLQGKHLLDCFVSVVQRICAVYP
jgi:hypothetical protein